MKHDEKFWPHFAGMLAGVLCMGLGVSLLIRVDMGTDPFSCFCLGLSRLSGISFGTCSVLFNGLLLIIVLLAGRNMIGLGTIGNMVLVGYSADFCGFVWDKLGWFPYGMPLPARLLLLVPALTIFTLAAALYMTANQGTSPYDALPFLLQKKISHVPFRWVRMAWDWIWIIGSLLLGQPIGIVSVLIALALGPVVGWVGQWAAHYLYGEDAA